ncbi:virion protein [Pseudoalteromonas fenneropenaei]|uniref:Virion protein n=1 Tax=Pseudoalteromonas fenneropenaei TaxID=1737459 RepID=A0ABV7CFJ9_9GAMM
MNTPRGIRNNNPLNIKTGENWLGLAGSDGPFVVFATSGHGIRAAGRILRTYSERHKRRTIRSIIERWAPPSENNTNAYIQFVAHKTGLDADRQLTLDDYPKLLDAMIQMENGQQPYSLNEIKQGFEWGFNR